MTKPKQDDETKKLTLERETLRELTNPNDPPPGIADGTKTTGSDTCQSLAEEEPCKTK